MREGVHRHQNDQTDERRKRACSPDKKQDAV